MRTSCVIIQTVNLLSTLTINLSKVKHKMTVCLDCNNQSGPSEVNIKYLNYKRVQFNYIVNY